MRSGCRIPVGCHDRHPSLRGSVFGAEQSATEWVDRQIALIRPKLTPGGIRHRKDEFGSTFGNGKPEFRSIQQPESMADVPTDIALLVLNRYPCVQYGSQLDLFGVHGHGIVVVKSCRQRRHNGAENVAKFDASLEEAHNSVPAVEHLVSRRLNISCPEPGSQRAVQDTSHRQAGTIGAIGPSETHDVQAQESLERGHLHTDTLTYGQIYWKSGKNTARTSAVARRRLKAGEIDDGDLAATGGDRALLAQ